MSDGKSNAEVEKKQSGAKKWIVIGALGLVLLGGGAAAGYFIGAKQLPPPAPAGAPAPAAAAAASEQAPVGPMVDIDSFIVNILDEQGSRYLKAALTLEVDNQATADEIKTRLPQVRDAILLDVGNKSFQELSDLQGKLQLRAELISHLNELLQKGQIEKIYFTDFVVQ